MNCTRWKFEFRFGSPTIAGFQGKFTLPFSSGRSVGFRLLWFPSAMSRSVLPGPVLLDRIVWSWSSRTNRSRGGAFLAWAPASNISSLLTLKNSAPYASFIAMKEAAIPPELPRNFRRLMPSFLETEAASSLIRYSTSFCFSVCGFGRYSPFETICVGIGPFRSSASSARSRPSSCSSLNRESSSREPGIFFGISRPPNGDGATTPAAACFPPPRFAAARRNPPRHARPRYAPAESEVNAQRVKRDGCRASDFRRCRFRRRLRLPDQAGEDTRVGRRQLADPPLADVGRRLALAGNLALDQRYDLGLCCEVSALCDDAQHAVREEGGAQFGQERLRLGARAWRHDDDLLRHVEQEIDCEEHLGEGGRRAG